MSYIKIQKIKKETVDQPEPGHIYLGYDDATVGGVGQGLWIKEDNITPAYYVLDGYTGAAPIIYSLTPTEGYAGITSVFINGNNFLATSTVFFGGIPCTVIQYVGPTQLRVTVPTNVSAGNVNVIVYNSTFSSSPMNFTVLNVSNNLPHIDTLNPTEGPDGTPVTIKGYNFIFGSTTNTKVYFGNIEANISTISSQEITTRCPYGSVPGAEVGIYVYVDSIGSSNTESFNVTANDSPTITAFDPISGYVGDIVNISGTNFYDGVYVSFGAKGATDVIVNSSTYLTAKIADLTQPTPNTYVQVGSSKLYGFEVLGVPSIPTIIDIYPTGQGPGQTVTISGTGLYIEPVSIEFGGKPTFPDTSIAPTTYTKAVKLGQISGVVDAVVQNANGQSTPYSYSAAIITNAPVINSFWGPNAYGEARIGETVTLSGSNFVIGTGNSVGVGTSSLSFTPATNVIGSSTTVVTFKIATGTQISPKNWVGIQTGPGLIGTKSGFNVLPAAGDAPTISGVSPMPGKAGDIISISGTNFTSDTTVGIGVYYPGIPASISTSSETYMTVVIPSGVTKEGDAVLSSIFVMNSISTADVIYEVYETPIYPAVVTSFTPTTGAVDAIINIVGYNFSKYYTEAAISVYDSVSKKYYNLSLNSITFISSTLLIAQLPSNPYSYTGSASLAVRNQVNTDWSYKAGFVIS